MTESGEEVANLFCQSWQSGPEQDLSHSGSGSVLGSGLVEEKSGFVNTDTERNTQTRMRLFMFGCFQTIEILQVLH